MWQPIETAPKDGTHILAWPCWDIVYVVKWTNRGQYGSYWVEASGEEYSDADPTHWMPLPEPPKGDE
jgi:hypothetical protein